MNDKHVVCPVCNSDRFTLKYQATYEYSYRIDANAPGKNNTTELLPYMYDNREQKDSKQYIECTNCQTSFPCNFDKWSTEITAEMLQETVDSANKHN